MFLLKKIISGWLMPVPFCLTLLVMGLWLVWTSKRINLGRFFLTCGVILLLLFSNKFVSTWLIRRLELAYRPIPELTVGASFRWSWRIVATSLCSAAVTWTRPNSLPSTSSVLLRARV